MRGNQLWNRFLKVNRELAVLMVLSGAAAITYVYDGFVTGDSIRYALGLQRITSKGIAEIRNVFNGELSLGYYLLMHLLVNLGDYSSNLSWLMNNLSAAASVIFQYFLFLFYNSLFGDRKLSFFACLSVLLSPSIWFLSHYGHPVILSLAFFVASLILFDKIAHGEPGKQRPGFLWLVFILLSIIAVAIRLDIVLAFGAYFGLLYFRRSLSISSFCRTVGALTIVLFAILGLRYFMLGYLINPTGGTFSVHIMTRLEPEFIIRNIIKNSALWTVSANVLIVLLAGFGFIWLGPLSGLGVLLVSWMTPWCIFLFFRGMDLGRIVAPTIPIFSLVATVFVSSIFKKHQVLSLALMLVLAQLIAASMYYPLVRFYPFKNEIDGHVLGSFPLEFPLIDHHYRQRAIREYDYIARQVTKESNENVLIIASDTAAMYYVIHLSQSRNIESIGKSICDGVVVIEIVTPQNTFYILNIGGNDNWLLESPIKTAIGCLDVDLNKIHLAPFSKEYPADNGQLYLTEQAIQFIFERERAVMDVRRKIIHY